MERLVRARVLLAEAEALGVTIDDLVAAASSSSAFSPGGGSRRAVAPVPTLAEYVDTVAPSFSASTAATYRSNWRVAVARFGDRPIDSLDADDCEAVLADAVRRAQQRRPGSDGRSSRENCVAALRALFGRAERSGLLTKNPARELDKPRRRASRRRALDDTELAEALDAVRTTSQDPDLDLLLVRFHLESGARREGALNLRLGDLDARRSTVLLREKFGLEGEQPVPPSLVVAVEGHARARESTGGQAPVFRSRRGEPITRRRYKHSVRLGPGRAAVVGPHPGHGARPAPHRRRRHRADRRLLGGRGLPRPRPKLGHRHLLAGTDRRGGRRGRGADRRTTPTGTATGRSPMSVTMLDTSSWTPAERQAAARDAYRASGYRLSGAELGRRFGRSARWGRAQIQVVATEDRAAAGGSQGRKDDSPVAAAEEATAAEALPSAAAGKGDDPGAPSVAASGSNGAANPARAAATGNASGGRHAGEAAKALASGPASRAAAASLSAPDGRRKLTAATGSHTAEPEVPAAVRWASAGAVVAVAFVAAVASYTHMLDLARQAGEGRLALVLPISVDGLVVAGSTTMVVRRRHGRGGGWLAWLAVGLGIGASLAANVVKDAAGNGWRRSWDGVTDDYGPYPEHDTHDSPWGPVAIEGCSS
jgi:site-specific recombinase XerD